MHSLPLQNTLHSICTCHWYSLLAMHSSSLQNTLHSICTCHWYSLLAMHLPSLQNTLHSIYTSLIQSASNAFTFYQKYSLLGKHSPSITRMHSSRMRTSHSLTVCWSLLPGGVSALGVSAPRGCLLLRGVYSWGCLLRGGVCSWQVSTLGVSAPRGCVCSGGVCSQGVSALGDVYSQGEWYPSMH